MDNAGNLGASKLGAAFQVSAFQESSGTIVDTGTWTTATLKGAYGGSVQHASAAGRVATFSVPTPARPPSSARPSTYS